MTVAVNPRDIACKALRGRVGVADGASARFGATRALSIDHTAMVGRSPVKERPALLFTMLRDRSAIPGREPPTGEPVMQRQEIADYLGLTIETVTHLHRFERARRHRPADDPPSRDPLARGAGGSDRRRS